MPSGTPFEGIIDVDVRGPRPDWEPFIPPMAPDGAPNVLIGEDGYRPGEESGVRARASSCMARHETFRLGPREPR
jgi:hypothetical protein